MTDTDADPDADAPSDAGASLDADAGADAAWFAGRPPTTEDGSADAGGSADADGSAAEPVGRERITTGAADEPRDWPRLAVESGFAADEDEYYDRLHEATLAATRATVRDRERADDQQLVHAVRVMDDCERTANELAERATEWAGSLFDDAEPGIEGARAVAERDPESEVEQRAVSLAERVADLAAERDALADTIDRTAPAVAPNLTEMAGPELAARLIALAGGLEPLAKKPSGTLQVLGAEDALFAHLSGRAPSPKHGVIYTHDYVRNTRPEDRGSASRALAGKLTLAARVDHYSGERRETLHEELRERMATIRARAEEGNGGTGTDDSVEADGE